MKNSINEFYQKIKVFILSSKENIAISIIIIFVGLASFGLGRLSVLEEVDDEVEIELSNDLGNMSSNTQDNEVLASNSETNIVGEKDTYENMSNVAGGVVASKSGKKYHYPWCSGAKQIAEKNKIIFNSIEEARDAGYTPASNCKGLK